MENDEMLLSALKSIPVDSLDYLQWVQVGMALKQGGHPLSLWDEWSRTGTKYKDTSDCEKHWNSFNGSRRPINPGYIIKLARDYGWKEYGDDEGVMEWNAFIGRDEPVSHATKFDHLDLDPAEELRKYIETLFRPDDFVGYVTGDSYQDADGKWQPTAGVYDRTASEILALLDKYKGKKKALDYAVGDWKEEAGAWIRFNALDGKGAKNDNVVRFKYALVESDSMAIEDQERLYRELELPIAAMVYSGGKSVHAIVKVDAKDRDEYDERVEKLYGVLADHGIDIDRQNKNPSRLSRMPGATRNGKRQQLWAVNIGKHSWAEWEGYIDGSTLPAFITLSDYFYDPPELPPELIEGVLRCGHKMLISSAAKAGKSFLLEQLCLAIATGGEWIGLKCRQGRVLYVNLEIDERSLINRFISMCKAKGIGIDHLDNVQILNLRGKAETLDNLVAKIIPKIKNENLAAIIFDPIYKVMTGDENSASDMGYFCNQFDRICTEAGCAAIYCHHHSKGAQGAKRAMDRASGSGVFARDPDAILDVIQLELDEDLRNNVADNDATAWRIEFILREFRDHAPINIWFEWPIHRVDTSGELSRIYPEGDPRNNLKRGTPEEQFRRQLDMAFIECSMGEQYVELNALAASLGVNDRTVRNHMKNYQDYEIKKGLVWKKTGDFPDFPSWEENR